MTIVVLAGIHWPSSRVAEQHRGNEPEKVGDLLLAFPRQRHLPQKGQRARGDQHNGDDRPSSNRVIVA